jgi:hypothetical protein
VDNEGDPVAGNGVFEAQQFREIGRILLGDLRQTPESLSTRTGLRAEVDPTLALREEDAFDPFGQGLGFRLVGQLRGEIVTMGEAVRRDRAVATLRP